MTLYFEKNTESLRVSLPGNLLLFGEYFILEEGGVGLSVATPQRGYLTLTPSERESRITLKWSDQEINFTISQRGSSEEFLSLFHSLQEEFPRLETLLKENPHHLTIDTSEFYEKERKLGLGSSAVYTSLFCVASILLCEGKIDLSESGKRELAHRILQIQNRRDQSSNKMRGSGYDIYTSLIGGTGFFKQGNPILYPSVQWTEESPIATVSLFFNTVSTSTTSSIVAWNEYRGREKSEWKFFVKEYSELIKKVEKRLTAEEGEDLFSSLFKEFVDLSERLGEAVGVPSRFQSRDTPSALWKSSGAGDEIFWRVKNSSEAHLSFTTNQEGIRIE